MTVYNLTTLLQSFVNTNKLAKSKQFRFCLVSGLEGMEEALASMLNTTSFCCLFDNASGYVETDNTPHTRRVHTVALALRHKSDDMAARRQAIEVLRELHRQLGSLIIKEQTRLREDMQYIEPRITMQETSQYLMPGTALCLMQIAVTHYTDLSYNENEWDN